MLLLQFKKPTPERWVSGLNQQFAKLPTLRGPVVRIHYSPQVWKANLSGLGARLESEAHQKVWGSAPQSSAS